MTQQTDLEAHKARMEYIRKDHWRQYEEPRDHEARAEAAEATAYSYFRSYTRDHEEVQRRIIAELMGLTAPRDQRAREAARRAYETSTAAARHLMEETFNEIMRDGEVSEAMSYRWDALSTASTESQAA